MAPILTPDIEQIDTSTANINVKNSDQFNTQY